MRPATHLISDRFAGAAVVKKGWTMNLKLLMAATAIGACLAAVGASATVLVVGAGWQYDQANRGNVATINSPWTFTVPSGKTYQFSLSDGFVPGDVYSIRINGLVTVNSVFTLFPTNFVNDLGPAAGFFATPWTEANFSHQQIEFSPGSFSLVIKDIHDAGLPAGVGVRLDAIPGAVDLGNVGSRLPDPRLHGFSSPHHGEVDRVVRRSQPGA